MSHNEITTGGGKKLAEIIQVNTTLQALDISYCGIPEDGALLISEAFSHSITLEDLTISWGNDKLLINTFGLSLNEQQNLHKLNINIPNYGIGDVGAVIISNLLYNTGIKTLNLSHNNLSYYGIVAVTELLKNNCTLQVLNLSHNKISIEGANKIVEIIESSTTLLVLDVSHCGIPDDGALAISMSYKESRVLQNLIISWNCDEYYTSKTISRYGFAYNLSVIVDLSGKDIGNVGAKIFSNLLYKNNSIKNLDISHNTLSDDGVAAIAEWLKNNCTLQTLKMSHNNISISRARKIAEAILVNTTLKSLDLSECGISDDGYSVISDSLKRNTSLYVLGLHNINNESSLCRFQ